MKMACLAVDSALEGCVQPCVEMAPATEVCRESSVPVVAELVLIHRSLVEELVSIRGSVWVNALCQ